jgi:hypothetical protein
VVALNNVSLQVVSVIVAAAATGFWIAAESERVVAAELRQAV